MKHAPSARVRGLVPCLVIVCLGVALILPGCSVPAGSRAARTPTGSDAAPLAADPDAGSAEAAGAGADDAILPPDVPFDAPADIYPQSWGLEWDDPFASDPQYTQSFFDKDAGLRSYVDGETGCEIMLFAGSNADIDPTRDDRDLSDELIAVASQISAEVVAKVATDGRIPQVAEGGAIAARVAVGAGKDGSSQATAARGVVSHGDGAFVQAMCPAGQSALDELESLMENGYVALTVAHRGID